MTEPTLKDRALMVVKTVASIVTWVVALVASLVRGRFNRA